MIPYGALVPETIDGLLVTEKSISVSHIANGATRLQPVVLNLGQVAGMAAALCVEQKIQPRDLKVQLLQVALLHDPQAPAVVFPLYDQEPTDHRYPAFQTRSIYPVDGRIHQPITKSDRSYYQPIQRYQGRLRVVEPNTYYLETSAQGNIALVTLWPDLDELLREATDSIPVEICGILYPRGVWLLVVELTPLPIYHKT
jgi:FAD dependent oxidoreductase